jgi:hypothetical protein
MFYGIALDVGNGKMYWAAYNLRKIQRANLDGSGIEDLPFICGGGPRGIAWDASSGTLFWTESNRIHAARLSSLPFEDPLELYSLGNIALDLGAGRLYWAYGAIQRARLDGTEKEDLVASPKDIILSLALDLDAGQMYFLSRERGDDATDLFLRRARIPKGRVTSPSSEIEDLVVTENCQSAWATAGIALDAVERRVYWTVEGWSPGSSYPRIYSCIQRAKLDGTAVESLVYINGNIHDIALDLRPTPSDSAGAGPGTSSLQKTWPFLGAAGAFVLLGLVMRWRLGVRPRRLTRHDVPSPDRRTLRAIRAAKLNKIAKWCCLCAAVLACVSWGMSTLCGAWYRGWEDEGLFYGRGIIRYDRKLPRLPAYMRDRWVFHGDELPGWQVIGSPSLTWWRQVVDQRSWATLRDLLGLSLPGATSRAFGCSGRITYWHEYAMPLWAPSLLFATLAIFLFRRDRERPGPGHCRSCGYNLTGNLSGICPECGTPTAGKGTPLPPTTPSKPTSV